MSTPPVEVNEYYLRKSPYRLKLARGFLVGYTGSSKSSNLPKWHSVGLPQRV
jgi:hypothetical protein